MRQLWRVLSILNLNIYKSYSHLENSSLLTSNFAKCITCDASRREERNHDIVLHERNVIKTIFAHQCKHRPDDLKFKAEKTRDMDNDKVFIAALVWNAWKDSVTNLEFPCGHIQAKKYHIPQVSEPV